MTNYHMLIERHDNGKWGPAFGDYDVEVVKDEMQDYRDHGIPRKHLAIITAEDNPEALGRAIDAFQKARDDMQLAKASERMMRGK